MDIRIGDHFLRREVSAIPSRAWNLEKWRTMLDHRVVLCVRVVNGGVVAVGSLPLDFP